MRKTSICTLLAMMLVTSTILATGVVANAEGMTTKSTAGETKAERVSVTLPMDRYVFNPGTTEADIIAFIKANVKVTGPADMSTEEIVVSEQHVMYSISSDRGQEASVNLSYHITTVNNGAYLNGYEKNLEITEGYNEDFTKGDCYAFDNVDGDISGKIKFFIDGKETTKLPSAPGKYTLVTQVTNSRGVTTKETTSITRKGNMAPVISLIEDKKTITEGSKVDLLKSVGVIADEEKLTATVTIDGKSFKTEDLKPGVYKVLFSAKDSKGNVGTATLTLTVKAKDQVKPDENKPVKPEESKPVKPDGSKPVKPDGSKPVTPNPVKPGNKPNPVKPVEGNKPGTSKPVVSKPNSTAPKTGDVASTGLVLTALGSLAGVAFLKRK